jgi:uncharacterized protein (UPF0261 family)
MFVAPNGQAIVPSPIPSSRLPLCRDWHWEVCLRIHNSHGQSIVSNGCYDMIVRTVPSILVPQVASTSITPYHNMCAGSISMTRVGSLAGSFMNQPIPIVRVNCACATIIMKNRFVICRYKTSTRSVTPVTLNNVGSIPQFIAER